MRFLREISPVEWVIACTALLLFVQYGLLPREVFFAPDEGMRLIVSRNLQPDSPFTGIVRYESRSVDPELAFVPYFDQWFSVAPGAELQVSYPIVWFAALIAPLYMLGGSPLAQAFPILCGALTGLLAGRTLDLLAGRLAATLGVIVVMLAIPSSLYSFLLWEHQLSAALCLLALACWVEHQTRPRFLFAATGAAAAACACAFRIEASFVAVPALLWIGYEQLVKMKAAGRKRLAVAGAVLGLCGILGTLYWFVARDTPYRLPVLAPALAPAQFERSLLQVVRVFVGYDASTFTSAALLGVLFVAGIGLLAKRHDQFACAGIVAGVLIATAVITALSVLRIEPFRVVNPGLLCGAPLLVLAILPLGSRANEDARLRFLRRALLTVFVGFVAGAFLTPRLASRAGGVMVQIGSTWGSRYFLAMYPLMAVAALASLLALLRAARRAPMATARVGVLTGAAAFGIGLAMAAGFLVNAIGLTRIDADKRIVLKECRAAWQASADVLVTDDWWRAPECADQTRPAYLLVRSPRALPDLRRALFNSSGQLELAYASRSGRLALQTLTESLGACFTVKQLPDTRSTSAGLVTRLSLVRRTAQCNP